MKRQRSHSPLPPAPKKTERAKPNSRNFTVRIAPQAEAAKLLNAPDRALLKPDCLAFLLYERRSGGAAAEQKPLGFCLAREAAEQNKYREAAQGDESREAAEPDKSAAAGSAQAANKQILEIALFRIDDKSAAKRGKTLLLRAVSDYCRKREIDYIFGRFSFTGKYPAAYAQEFSCLYHYYRIKNGGGGRFLAENLRQSAPRTGAKKASMDLMPAEAATPDKTRHLYPSLLRYCLKLGAKTADNVAVDREYNHGAGAMNVFLWLSAKPLAAAPAVKQKNSSAAPP